MSSGVLFAQATPPWYAPWIPVAVVAVLLPLVPLVTRLVRAKLMGRLKSISFGRERNMQRVETLVTFVGSILYFALVLIGISFALQAVFPSYNPWAATGALSIVALFLTGIFRDMMIDVVRGIGILFGGHYDVGDFIDVGGGYSGYVTDFQLMYTKLRSISGEEVVLNNSRCIPSRRFPAGWVLNHVDIPLADAADEPRARELLDRLAWELHAEVECVRDTPICEQSVPRPASGGVLLRYHVRVVPGASWVLDEVFLPAIRRSFEQAGIPLAGEPSSFFMNDVGAFRGLFGRSNPRPV
ncbi:MAG: mechanosensitive ion channel family protein [Planctomycetaceae bacterium]|nr:mechanosensitive ion channel family protein [Planctomycetaceae bacterium]